LHLPKHQKQLLDHLRTASLRITRLHLVYVGLYVAQTIVFHASKVITPELLLKRWWAASGLAVVTIAAWFIAKHRATWGDLYRFAIWLVILADLAFAAFNVYTQRGYASKSVLLFVIPIVVAAALANKTALFTTAALAIVTYTTTAISYFVLNFNEGYLAELYAEIGLYSGLFLVTAALLWAVVPKHK
jgi:hypothetical protein